MRSRLGLLENLAEPVYFPSLKGISFVASFNRHTGLGTLQHPCASLLLLLRASDFSMWVPVSETVLVPPRQKDPKPHGLGFGFFGTCPKRVIADPFLNSLPASPTMTKLPNVLRREKTRPCLCKCFPSNLTTHSALHGQRALSASLEVWLRLGSSKTQFWDCGDRDKYNAGGSLVNLVKIQP